MSLAPDVVVLSCGKKKNNKKKVLAIIRLKLLPSEENQATKVS